MDIVNQDMVVLGVVVIIQLRHVYVIIVFKKNIGQHVMIMHHVKYVIQQNKELLVTINNK